MTAPPLILRPPPHLNEASRWRGRRVGLFGGTFDPPHEGHYHVATTALKALDLDAIWWMVSPQNPLKSRKASALEERTRLCQTLVNSHPKIHVSTLESDFSSSSTYQTVTTLQHHFPSTHFCWISGLDIALTLHEWNNWHDLLNIIPFAHIARPPADTLVKRTPVRLHSTQTHRIISTAGRYRLTPGYSYWVMNRKMIPQSSSKIRATQKKHLQTAEKQSSIKQWV